MTPRHPDPPKLSWDSARLRYTLTCTNNQQKNPNPEPTPYKIKRVNKKIFCKKILKYQELTGIKIKKVIYTTQKKTYLHS